MESNMIIGNLVYDKKTDRYEGNMQLLCAAGVNVSFSPNAKSSAKGPDYRVTFERHRDCQVEIGAPWKRISEKGQEFLSVSIDYPTLPAPVNAALFPSDDGERASLICTRPALAAGVPGREVVMSPTVTGNSNSEMLDPMLTPAKRETDVFSSPRPAGDRGALHQIEPSIARKYTADR
jgi:uncharacterized protein (DUF736 family)